MPLTDKSYATLAEADAYWLDRNDSVWLAATDVLKDASLIKATEYIDYQFDWIGGIKVADQVLLWPRSSARDKEGRLRDGIPTELKNAVSWLALHLLTQDKEVDPPKDRGGDIQKLKAGPVEIEYLQKAVSGTTYDHLYRMLSKIIIGSKNQMRLIRT